MTQVQVETWFLENIANFTIIFGAEIKDSYFLSSKPTDPEFLKKKRITTMPVGKKSN